jgi:hypothetical protein
MLLAASLQAWDHDHGRYRTLARICAAVAVAGKPAALLIGARRGRPVRAEPDKPQGS